MELEEGRGEEVEVSGGADGCWVFCINTNDVSSPATMRIPPFTLPQHKWEASKLSTRDT